MTRSRSIVPLDSREYVLGLLSEAAEVEHNLMCCYLYAAFSLKEGLDEDLRDDELTAVRRWRRVIIDIAVEEMAHLAIVANLQCALGASPHFGRLNFPIGPGSLPAGIVVQLAPFNRDTLDHFIYLERPEDAPVSDGRGFEAEFRYSRGTAPGRLMPSSQDYETVGQLYAAIADGLRFLVERHGEDVVFVGEPARQLGLDVVALKNVSRVRCLKTALAGIEAIVVQGEGSQGAVDSHFARFSTIRDEYDALVAARSSFHPARPAAHNPVMRRPVVPDGRVWIEDEPAASLVDLANAAYNHMLRLLIQSYVELRGLRAQRAMIQAAVDMMRVISPIASVLTRHSANATQRECTAGMSFATLRSLYALTEGRSGDAVLVERLRDLSHGAEKVCEGIERLKGVPGQLMELAEELEKGLVRNAPALAPVPAPTPAPAPAPTLAPAPAPEVEVVEGKSLTLLFDSKRCIHSRHCVLGQPTVFKANVVGPWLDPDACSTESLVTVAHLCPSGAIQLRRKDGGPDERAPAVNLVQLRENGPLGVRAQLRILGGDAGFRATLCRCGGSKNKPYCDGTHNGIGIGFVASGEPVTRTSEPLEVRDGVLDVRPQRNGCLVVKGNLEICAGTGRTVDRVTRARLCRCGHSQNKPFCDGSHERVGFVADGE